MASATSIPVDVYLHSDYEPDAEYVDGQIEERAVGEYDHATWQYAIQKWFTLHEAAWNIRVRSELRVQVSPSRFRVPDVIVFERNLPREQVITFPPVAVFEILSPEDRLPRMLSKLQDYTRMGILNILVIDARDGSCWRYVHGELLTAVSGELEASPCRIDWDEIRTYLE